MSPPAIIAIDAGRSGVRVATADESGLRPIGTAQGIEHSSRPDAAQLLRTALATALAAWTPPRRAAAVGIGLTGVFAPSSEALAVAAVVSEQIETPLVHVANDAVTGYLGALGTVPGVVVAAGTGTICLALSPEGDTARVDGWGYLLGDDGSGFSIGRAGLAAGLRAADGRGGSPALLAALRARYGDISPLVTSVYATAQPAAQIAAFAPDVAALARAGDRTAADILSHAGTGLAESVAAAARRVFEPDDHVEVAATGGVTRLGPGLTDAFTSALARLLPTARVRPPDGNGLLGAARLARGALGRLDGHVQRRQGAA